MCARSAAVLGYRSQLGRALSASGAPTAGHGCATRATVVSSATRAPTSPCAQRARGIIAHTPTRHAGRAGRAARRRAAGAERPSTTIPRADSADHGLGAGDAIRQPHPGPMFARAAHT